MTEDHIIKPAPLMTSDEMIAAIQSLQQTTTDFIGRYNAKNYGNKVREDGRVIMSKGRQEVGSGNDILILDGSDVTYRMWGGNKVASSAPFRVTKAGVVYSGGTAIPTTYTGVFLVGTGSMESGWGATSSWSAGTPASGKITITHNLGTTNYTVLVTVMNGSAMKRITLQDRLTNSFTVHMTDAAGTDELNDFSFQLILKP